MTETRTVQLSVHPALAAYMEWLDVGGVRWSDRGWLRFRANWEAQHGAWSPDAEDGDDDE